MTSSKPQAATTGLEGGDELVTAIAASSAAALAPLVGHVLFPLRAVAQHPTATEAARISVLRGISKLSASLKQGLATACYTRNSIATHRAALQSGAAHGTY